MLKNLLNYLYVHFKVRQILGIPIREKSSSSAKSSLILVCVRMYVYVFCLFYHYTWIDRRKNVHEQVSVYKRSSAARGHSLCWIIKQWVCSYCLNTAALTCSARRLNILCLSFLVFLFVQDLLCKYSYYNTYLEIIDFNEHWKINEVIN